MATERLQVYRCGTCGSLLEVLTGGPGAMSCCGLPMQRLYARRDEVGWSRHLPAIQKTADGFAVKVGFSPHPMEKAH